MDYYYHLASNSSIWSYWPRLNTKEDDQAKGQVSESFDETFRHASLPDSITQDKIHHMLVLNFENEAKVGTQSPIDSIAKNIFGRPE